jgi:hypothetical protein
MIMQIDMHFYATSRLAVLDQNAASIVATSFSVKNKPLVQ